MNKSNQSKAEDIMRIMANLIIDRILEDKAKEVLMFTKKRDTLIKSSFGFKFIDYATYKIPYEN